MLAGVINSFSDFLLYIFLFVCLFFLFFVVVVFFLFFFFVFFFFVRV